MSDLKKFQLIYFLLGLSIFSALVFAQTLPGDWKGYVTINLSTAQNGAVVSAILNNNTTVVVTTTVGAVESGTGYYLIHVPGDSGNTVRFQVCGINVSIPDQSWSAGPHPNSSTSSPYINLSVNTSANGASCTYACGCSGGFCNSNVCASSAPSAGTGTTGGTGGGGGVAGGGATGTTTTTTVAPPVEEIKLVGNISSGQTANVSFNKSDSLKIQEISIETTNNVNNVQITIKETTQPSGANLVIGSDAGAVYKYLEITKSNIQDSDISKVKIKFKVEKSWLASNNIDKNTVSLSRLVGNTWTKLPTSILSEDSTYVYFEAESPGLSIFAITGNKLVSTQTTTTPDVTTGAVPVGAKPIDMTYVWIILVVLVAAFAYFFLRYRKKKVTDSSPS